MVNIMRNAGGNGKVVEMVQPEDDSLNAEGFVGVDPIYQNFANDTDAPLKEDEPGETEEIAATNNDPSDPSTGKEPGDEDKAPESVPTGTGDKSEGDKSGETSTATPTAKPATKAGTPKSTAEPKI